MFDLADESFDDIFDSVWTLILFALPFVVFGVALGVFTVRHFVRGDDE